MRDKQDNEETDGKGSGENEDKRKMKTQKTMRIEERQIPNERTRQVVE